MGKYFQGILLAVPYFLNLNSSNRTMLGILLFLILIEILRILKKKYSISSISFFALLFLILVFLFKEELLDLLLLLFDKNSTIGMRIFQLKIASLEGLDYSNPFFTSITQRIIEAETVYYYWTNNIITFIFGSGLGGVIDGRKVFIDESVLNSALLGAKNIHNIHILPFALIFRYGIFGVLLFFQIIRLFYKSIKYILVTNLQENNVYFIFWNIFVFLWILFSIPASSFLWTMPIFWISLTYSNKTQSYINE